MKRGSYPRPHDGEKYPGGENLLDFAERSKKAITQLVLPLMWKVAKEGSTDIHVAVVSHGLFLFEMIYKLLQMSQNQAVDKGCDYVMPYLENGAWTRIVINIEVRVVE